VFDDKLLYGSTLNGAGLRVPTDEQPVHFFNTGLHPIIWSQGHTVIHVAGFKLF